MNDPIKLHPNYNPKVEPIKDLQLPIELKNSGGENLATIYYSDYFKKYNWSVNGISNHSDGHYEFNDCLEDCFARMYQTMQEYRKIAEEHHQLTTILKKALR